MEAERHVRLFRNGRNQAIRIPKEFELEGDEAILRKEDGHLVIEPVQKKDLVTVLAGLEDLDEPFPDVDEGLGAPDEVDWT
jgi:antitoxin VapB